MKQLNVFIFEVENGYLIKEDNHCDQPRFMSSKMWVAKNPGDLAIQLEKMAIEIKKKQQGVKNG